MQELKLVDGTTFLGRILRVDSLVVMFQASYGTIAIDRVRVASVRDLHEDVMRDGEVWFPSANTSRLLFGPTGRTLHAGDAYLANHDLFLMSGAVGLSDRFTFGAGMSILPSSDFIKNNVYFLLPKYGVVQGAEFNASVGVLLAAVPAAGDLTKTFGMAYGAATWGGTDASVTAALGYGYASGKLANRPALMLGTEQRLTKRVAFISENYFFTSFSGALLSYGIRFLGEDLSVDLAFVNATSEAFFPGIPWVGFSFRF
jgi:hypothetical protein